MAIRDDTYDHNSSIPFLEIGLIFTFMNTNVFNLYLSITFVANERSTIDSFHNVFMI